MAADAINSAIDRSLRNQIGKMMTRAAQRFDLKLVPGAMIFTTYQSGFFATAKVALRARPADRKKRKKGRESIEGLSVMLLMLGSKNLRDAETKKKIKPGFYAVQVAAGARKAHLVGVDGTRSATVECIVEKPKTKGQPISPYFSGGLSSRVQGYCTACDVWVEWRGATHHITILICVE